MDLNPLNTASSVRVPDRQSPSLATVGKSLVDAPATRTLQPLEPAPLRVAIVDILGREAAGLWRVSIEGAETLATSSAALPSTGRFILQVDRSLNGVLLSPVPDSPELTTVIATALLRGEPPPLLGETAPALLRELTQLPPNLANTATQHVVETLQAMMPQTDQPPTAEQLRAVVERGGEHAEANLARRVLGERKPLGNDLKSGVLRLLQTIPDVAHVLPSAKPVLDGIEARQASQVLAREHGGPFVFQVPFIDGTRWQTLRLAVEQDHGAASSQGEHTNTSRGFRIMMHTPLEQLGDVWLDARLDTHADHDQFRAVLYLADTAAREQLRGELDELRNALLAQGFEAVQLEVQSTSELSDRQARRMNAVISGMPEFVNVLDVRV